MNLGDSYSLSIRWGGFPKANPNIYTNLLLPKLICSSIDNPHSSKYNQLCMTTLDEIIERLRHLPQKDLTRVHAFIQALQQEQRGPSWCFDFVECFPQATAWGMEVKVAPATCGGITRIALWEHPPASGSARVAYLVPIPAGVRAMTLKFAIGIRDGSELPLDRFVAFRVLVNGWKLWSAVKSSREWEDHAVAMPQFNSDLARIEFITDGLGDNRWNWAVWAEPRLEGRMTEDE